MMQAVKRFIWSKCFLQIIHRGLKRMQKSGKVTITVCQGALIHTIIVSDDGCGFDPAKMQEDSLGLSIVRATVQDKLKGKLHIVSSAEGTKVSFDFKNE